VNTLEYWAAVTPTTNQYFRAEFVQYGPPGNASGPRVYELDGYDFVIPEPAAMPLLGAGLILLAWFRKR
jgi:hypothetical protein